MPTSIEQTITSFNVKKEELPIVYAPIERPDILTSTTYKIKSLDQAFYISISDIEIEGKLYPYEIFVNTKSVNHMAYLTAITRLVSAFFRTRYPYEFIAEELKQIHDAKDGNYFKRGMNFPSLIAEIGYILGKHFQDLNSRNSMKKDIAQD